MWKRRTSLIDSAHPRSVSSRPKCHWICLPRRCRTARPCWSACLTGESVGKMARCGESLSRKKLLGMNANAVMMGVSLRVESRRKFHGHTYTFSPFRFFFPVCSNFSLILASRHVKNLKFPFIRLNALMIGSKPNVSVDRIIWHLVKLFGSPCDYNLIRKCEKLVGFIGTWKPEMRSSLKGRESSMESAVQGKQAYPMLSN